MHNYIGLDMHTKQLAIINYIKKKEKDNRTQSREPLFHCYYNCAKEAQTHLQRPIHDDLCARRL